MTESLYYALKLRIEEEKKTAGGIIIPDTVKEKPQQGEIISIGPSQVEKNGKRIHSVDKFGKVNINYLPFTALHNPLRRFYRLLLVMAGVKP